MGTGPWRGCETTVPSSGAHRARALVPSASNPEARLAHQDPHPGCGPGASVSGRQRNTSELYPEPRKPADEFKFNYRFLGVF